MISKTLFFGNPAYLRMEHRQLKVELVETGELRSIPIEDIGLIVLEHQQITLSNALLAYLLEQNIGVITCGQNHHPVGYWLPMTGHSEYAGNVRNQIGASKPLNKQLWRQTVEAKVMNQGLVLKENNLPWLKLKRWAEAVRSNDKSNIEGMAAAHYWQYLFKAETSTFVRDRYGPPPNNLLNYGYAILRALTARCLVASGLLPLLGMYHRNQYNPFCLADDVMEPYRPFVDRIAKRVITDDGEENLFELTKPHKQAMLQLPVVDTLIEDKRSPLSVAMQRTTASLAKCYNGEQRKIHYPTFPEV